MNYAQAPAAATLDLPDLNARIVPTGDRFILWWTDCATNQWHEDHPNLSTALARLAVLYHCTTTGEGFNHPTPSSEFTDLTTAFLQATTTGPRNQP